MNTLLIIDYHPGSIQAALDLLSEPEIIEGENAVDCEACGFKPRAHKYTSYEGIPAFLIVQIKRFGYNQATNTSYKYMQPVEINR